MISPSPGRVPPPSTSKLPSERGTLSSTKNAVKSALVLLEKAVDGLPIPGLKAAAGSAVEIIKITEEAKQNQEALRDLASHLRSLESAVIAPLLEYQDQGIPLQVQARVERLTGELNDLASHWQRLKTFHTRTKRFVSYEDFAIAIQDINRRIAESVKAFEVKNQVATAILVEQTRNEVVKVKKHLISQLIKDIPFAEAAFNSISRSDAPICFKDTREEVLQQVFTWFREGDQIIYILKGIAGVGKTTIAQTVAVSISKEGCLAASFYFSRFDSNRNTFRRFFTTIARQFAFHNSAFARELAKVLEEAPDVASEAAALQFKKLILDPLRSLQADELGPMFVVLDALDECKEEEGAQYCQSTLCAVCTSR